ncbi:hypothetical protein KTJ16_02130 [Acinetobacter bereziniae]|uniref:hypothetical protein n=1 Tax=Acinetobacter bereziniae TaxID=106648 RepID=UPI000EF731B1|nr:hypothetical protein [Acinetobacter bereziniae]MBJ8421358.1 hypothetical protein [Acinetobacter bereziniae]MCU4475075.1 hypothetical protein [Acinetobacter bereziniae]MCU4539974.1 hypothetical protein [Acinetobacter bereziniae]MCU4626723.1 hypothetical protein [Acinetobacter bereziniae]
MFEEFLTKLLNPSISFLAIYVSVIVVIAYIGLLFQFFKIKNLKQENETLKHQLSSQVHSKISLSKHEGIIS